MNSEARGLARAEGSHRAARSSHTAKLM